MGNACDTDVKAHTGTPKKLPCIHMCMCPMCVHMPTYTSMQTHRERKRDTERERQKHRKRERGIHHSYLSVGPQSNVAYCDNGNACS